MEDLKTKLQQNTLKLTELRNKNEELNKQINNNIIIINQLQSESDQINVQLLKMNKKINTIKELHDNISNNYQQQILDRLLTDSEYAKIYLSSFEINKDTKKKDVSGTIKVLGTYNEKKEKREEYEIKVYNDSPKGTFWCTCSDHKFNSTKKGTVCKHICFIVCKVMKILNTGFFESKKLSTEQLNTLIQKLSSENIWNDTDITTKMEKISIETFKSFSKAINDCCPMCYNDLSENDKPILLSCPSCHNYLHKECAEIWLEKQTRCMLCKSTCWENYNKVKNGEVITNLSKNKNITV